MVSKDKEKKQGCFRNFIKNQDSYGVEVNLVYDQSNATIQTFPGGLATILSRLTIFIFFLYKSYGVYNQDHTLQTSVLRRDLTTDQTRYKLSLNNFDFGLRIENILDIFELEVSKNLELYVDVKVTQNYYKWTRDSNGTASLQKFKDRVDLIPCKAPRLGLQNNIKDYLGISQNFLCPQNINFTIQGSLTSQDTQFIQISVKECNQKDLDRKYGNGIKVCKSIEETMRVAAHLKMYLTIQNSYFKDNDFGPQPIKKFLKTYYITSIFNTSNYQFMLLSENLVEMHDNFLLGKPKYDSFIETKIDYGLAQSLQDDDGMINPFIGVYIQMDDSYKITIRKVTTLEMAAADTGGFMSVIFAITIILVRNFQQKIYHSTLIRDFYRVANNQSKIEEEEEESIDSVTSKMLDRLKRRKPFQYGINDILKYRCLKFFCCNKVDQNLQKKHMLYKKGVEKLNQDLNIKNIYHQLRSLRFMVQSLLTEPQRMLISYFKDSLINQQTKYAWGQDGQISMQEALKNVIYEKGNQIESCKMLMNVLDADQVKEFNIENNSNQLKQQQNVKKEILTPMIKKKSGVQIFKNHRGLSPVNQNQVPQSFTPRIIEKHEGRRKEEDKRQGNKQRKLKRIDDEFSQTVASPMQQLNIRSNHLRIHSSPRFTTKETTTQVARKKRYLCQSEEENEGRSKSTTKSKEFKVRTGAQKTIQMEELPSQDSFKQDEPDFSPLITSSKMQEKKVVHRNDKIPIKRESP